MDFLLNMMEKICLLKMKGTKFLVINLDKICNQDCLFCFGKDCIMCNMKNNCFGVCSEYLDKFKDDGFIQMLL